VIKVLIVDDMIILRDCLKLVISQEDDFQVVGTASDGQEAVWMYREFQPDIILMDLNMPIFSGHEAIAKIKLEDTHSKILVLTVDGDERNITKAFENGADGYVLKDISPEELFQVMKNAFCEEPYVNESSFYMTKESYKIENTGFTSNNPYDVELTDREKYVIELVIEGMTNEEIAEHIGVSVGRARNIVADLISKFMVKNRTQLAVIAVKLRMQGRAERK
jgi:DNA-binding NarL/FixJ family response regulator